jgi:hypothetical protein
MKTLVAVISYGSRDNLTDVSFRRAAHWASRQGYSVVLIKEPLHQEGRQAHYGKLRVHHAFPKYDRYCVVDDDILISSNAGPLPEIPASQVGLVPDAEQRHTTNPKVDWTGNTGFILATRGALDLLDKAYERGDDETVWGIADQGALNSVAWDERRVHQLEWMWNYQAVLEYFLRGRGWESWQKSHLYRLSFYLGLRVHLPHPVLRKVRTCYGLHMIRAPYPKFFDSLLPKY